jgi:LPXTG-motif cell wall-anchored protein
MRKTLAGLTAITLGLAGAIAFASPAAAATYTVTSNADTDTPGTLRYAVNHLINPAGGDTIDFVDGLAPIVLTASLDIGAGVTIDGDADGDGGGITISRVAAGSFTQLGLWPDTGDQDYVVKDITIQNGAGGTGLPFHAGIAANAFAPDDVTLLDVSIFGQVNPYAPIGEIGEVDGDVLVDNGSFAGNAGGAPDRGGMYIWGIDGASITIRNSGFNGNSTQNNGGALSFDDIANSNIVLESNRFQNNSAALSGGAVYGATVSNFTVNDAVGTNGFFSNNDAATGNGGGIALDTVSGAVNISDVAFTDHDTPQGSGAAIWTTLAAGAANLTSVRASNNAAGDDGGAFYLSAGAPGVTLTDVQVEENGATGNGGGAFINATNWRVDLALFAGNLAGGSGGAIYGPGIYAAGSSVSRSTFARNDATTGGAIATLLQSYNLDIVNSVFSDNHFSSSGGALYVSPISGGGSLLVNNSTFSSQRLDGDNIARGTSIRVASLNGNVGIYNSTFDELMTVDGEAVGIGNIGLGSVTIGNSTLRGPASFLIEDMGNNDSLIENSILQATEYTTAIRTDETDGGEIRLRYSVLDTGLPALVTNVVGNQLNTDPKLGNLADNGGDFGMYTRLPLTGSPAIGKADPAYAGPLTTDERGPGFARVSGGRLDAGAVEVQVAAELAATGSESSGVIALLALGMLALGGVALVGRRRVARWRDSA